MKPLDIDNLLQPTTKPSIQVTDDQLNDKIYLPPCNVKLSTHPFFDNERIELEVRGQHSTQGLILKESPDWDNRIMIKGCYPNTSGQQIRGWIKRIKNSLLMKVNNTDINTLQQAKDMFNQILKTKKKHFHITVCSDKKSAMNTEEGVPFMYFDQLLTISSHLHAIKYNQSNCKPHPVPKQPINDNAKINKVKATLPRGILPKNKRKANKLTRRKLKLQENWPLWHNSEWKQLEQYESQETFGLSCKLPIGTNVLDLLWTYLIKTDSTLKARMVCNGQPLNKNTIIFSYTFAKMLDHVGSRIFWAICATKNYIVCGADASNAFAEASAPKIPLYVRIDTPYREWWTQHKKRAPIPEGYVLLVKKALQGHPESSRSWAILIDGILRTKLKLKPTTHEPYLYKGIFKGHKVLFLHQVDNFAVASESSEINKELIAKIDRHMKIDIKDLGRLSRYNGVDITQGCHYIKLSNKTYLNKVFEGLIHGSTTNQQ